MPGSRRGASRLDDLPIQTPSAHASANKHDAKVALKYHPNPAVTRGVMKKATPE
ncbi:MAG: hypothetical protein M3P30_08695 [Chloroflexota bacterium]|nr:hypothetical protein [Chloroflexota bacterium]